MQAQRPSPFYHQLRGFTLIELMVTVAVAGVMLSIATPSLQGLVDARHTDGAAVQLAADLRYARSEAVMRNQSIRVSFLPTTAGSCYVIHTGASSLCQCAASGPAQCSAGAEQIKTVTLATNDRISLQSNVSSLLFDPLHGTSTPTGTLRVNGPHDRAVQHVINLTGRIRSCSPQASVSGYPTC